MLKLIVSNMIITVLEYRVSSDPSKLPGFSDLLWDLRDARKISKGVDAAVKLYEFAVSKPGVSCNPLLLLFHCYYSHRISMNSIYKNLSIYFPLSKEGLSYFC